MHGEQTMRLGDLAHLMPGIYLTWHRMVCYLYLPYPQRRVYLRSVINVCFRSAKYTQHMHQRTLTSTPYTTRIRPIKCAARRGGLPQNSHRPATTHKSPARRLLVSCHPFTSEIHFVQTAARHLGRSSTGHFTKSQFKFIVFTHGMKDSSTYLW